MNLNQIFLVLVIYYVAVAINTLTNKTTMVNFNRGLVINQVVNVEPLYNLMAELLLGLMTGGVDGQHHQRMLRMTSAKRTPQFRKRMRDPKSKMRSVFENSIGSVDYNGSLSGFLWVL